jgi:hypothetical protein
MSLSMRSVANDNIRCRSGAAIEHQRRGHGQRRLKGDPRA